MANSISTITSNLAQIMDKLYKVDSKTAILDNNLTRTIEGVPGSVLIPKMSFSNGLADYSKSAGYTASDVNLAWETFALQKDRAIKLVLDAVDNIDTAGIVLAQMMSEYYRTQIAPELDSYRLSTYATEAITAGNDEAATLTSSTVVGAIRDACSALEDNEVPQENLVLFISPTCRGLLEEALGANTFRMFGTYELNDKIKTYKEMPIISVPSARFSTVTNLTQGGGFTHVGGLDINFMILDKSAVMQPMNRDSQKLIIPEINQSHDGYAYMTRLHHDAFVLDNKVNGIFVHHKAPVITGS